MVKKKFITCLFVMVLQPILWFLIYTSMDGFAERHNAYGGWIAACIIGGAASMVVCAVYADEYYREK